MDKKNNFKYPSTAHGEPQAMGGPQLALHDVPFLKHSQIQGNYTSNLDKGPDNDKPQIRPEAKKRK
jgi:hypothetical protein